MDWPWCGDCGVTGTSLVGFELSSDGISGCFWVNRLRVGRTEAGARLRGTAVIQVRGSDGSDQVVAVEVGAGCMWVNSGHEGDNRTT